MINLLSLSDNKHTAIVYSYVLFDEEADDAKWVLLPTRVHNNPYSYLKRPPTSKLEIGHGPTTISMNSCYQVAK